MEIKREIRIFEVRYQCPECNNGELIFSHQSKLSSPPQNLHTCTNRECRHQEWIRGKKYPTTEHVYVDKEKPNLEELLNGVTEENRHKEVDWGKAD